MADPIYELPENPVYDEQLRKLQNSDPAHAETIFNPLLEKMIHNTHYVKKQADSLEGTIDEIMEDGLDADNVVLSDGTTLEAALEKKADLVNGKVRAEQLPEMAYDPAGSAAGVQENLETHTKNADIHITASDRSNWNTAATTAAEAKTAAAAAQATADAAKSAIDNADISSRFILSITFDSELSGNAFTVTGTGLSHNGTVPNSLQVIVEAPTANTTYTVSSSGYSTAISVGQYYGVYTVYLDALPDDVSDFTWSQFKSIIAHGESEVRKYFSPGDEKTINLTTGETLTLQIYGLYHDDLADGSGKAPITFGLKNLMAETRRMEASNTNVNGFTGSEMYGWLTGTLLPSLPADLRDVIRPVIKKTSAGDQSTTIQSQSMSIFLFSEVECFGTTTYSVPGEGSQYPIFTDNISRIKYLANGTSSANVWWERSPVATSSTIFCNVISNGGASTSSASYSSGVCFGFCI